jgi:glycogen debranching enzyme
MTITVSFTPDLKPMWPGGLGGQAAGWNEDLKAFVISESRRKFNGFFGCPAAAKGVATPAHQLASGGLRFDIKVDPNVARQSYYPLIIAGGINGRQPVIDLYQRLSKSVAEQYQKTFQHYRRLRDEMLSVESPEKPLNLAFEWAKASLDKGMVENPDLGYGLVAGWGATGEGARPGFGWFFGGDAAMNSYAMTGYGDFDSARAALQFLAKYQRADGKIPHEISQAAGMVKWFEEYPYAYLHADTTPFYIAAAYNLYRQSGDKNFVRGLWPALKKAYEFCVANDTDGDGILENSKAGLGASELGSLLTDLHQDIYLAATSLEASSAMVEMAQLMNDGALAGVALDRKNKAFASLNELYWDQKSGRYVYALTKDGKQNPEVTAWTAVPMMFTQLDANRAGETLANLSASRISTDWGARMLSAGSPAYDPIAYNNGGVWPFLTGFVSCAEYEYHRPQAGYAHLRQLAQLTFDSALGYHPEILSGDYYRPLDESVPHQLFSSAMVITPLIRGLLGARPDAGAAPNRALRLAPQLPAAWDSLRVRNYRVGTSKLNFDFKRVPSSYRLELSKEDDDAMKLQYAPALPALARINRVLVDGKQVKFTTKANGGDQVCNVEFTMRRRAVVEILFKGGIEIDVPFEAALTGERSRALKVIELSAPAGNRLVARLEGLQGRVYMLRARVGTGVQSSRGGQPVQAIQSVQGGALRGEENGWKLIEVSFPASADANAFLSRMVEINLK